MNRELFSLLVWIPMGLMGLVAFTGIVKLKKLGYSQKLIALLCGVSLLIELCAKYLWQFRINNYFVYHLYSVAEFTILALLYSQVFQNTFLRKFLRYCIVAIWFFAAFNAIFWQPLDTSNTHVASVTYIVWMVIPIVFFFQITTDLRYQHLEKSAMFWINIGVLIFHASIFVLITFSNRVAELTLLETGELWKLNIAISTLTYTIFLISLWMKPE